MRRESDVIQTPSTIPIRHNLHRGIHAIRDIQRAWNGHMRQTEFPQPDLRKSRLEDDIEIIAHIVAEAEEHLDDGLIVAHCESDGD